LGERRVEVLVLEVGGEVVVGPARVGCCVAVGEDQEFVSAAAAGERVAVGVDAEEDPAVRAEQRRFGERDVDGDAGRGRADRDATDIGGVSCVADRVAIHGAS
jgi:hypothetical protein